MPVDFQMFEGSSAGGDFATFYGEKSQHYYRVDLEGIFRRKEKIEDILRKIDENEKELNSTIKIPYDLKCPFCGSRLGNCQIMIDNECTIHAIVI